MRWSRSYLVPVLATFILLIACCALQPPFLGDLRNFVFDSWQRLAPRPFDPNGPVRIVAIDEASLAAYGQWPWPRTKMAEVTRRLSDLGAAAIVFDIIFSEPDRTSFETIVSAMPAGPVRDEFATRLAREPSHDQVFADALAQANTVVAATLLPTGPSHDLPAKAGFVTAGDDPQAFLANFAGIAAPQPRLSTGAKGIGATNWLPDRDQVVRRIPVLVREDGRMVPSLALEAVRVAQGASTIIVRSSNASGQGAFGAASGINAIKVGDVEVDTGPNADIRPFYTPTRSDRFVSATRLLGGTVDRKEIEGRIVFVGTTAIGLGDVRATPLDAAVAGVEIQAQVAEAILAGAIVARPDWAEGAEAAGALLACVAIAFALPLIPPLIAALLVVATIAATATVSFLAFDRGHVLVDPALPSIAVISVYLVGTLALWRAERITKQQIRTAFGKFLSPAVVDRLAADPRGLVLGGETRDMTVLFSDLRNFARLSEGLDAHDLTQFMNAYLTPMTDAILDHDGTVDKYIGDAIVAFWNAPLTIADHTARAIDAALRMRAALVTFNAERRQLALDTGATFIPAAIGIGINAGPCTVGNIGSLRRFDYSVLGDTVNLASRLEGVSKLYFVDIVVSGRIAAMLPDLAWIELDRVRVKGRTDATTIFTLAGDAVFAASDEFAAWQLQHVAMLDRYRAQDFPGAVSMATALCRSVPSFWTDLYIEMARWFEVVAAAPQRTNVFPIRVLDSK